ncbi:hypothetical protein TELCIR_18026 [Teladorsagia circumcincta]|uniref:Uncharacterized protein n=1 Tax=Teladorsagia circumcincta TaxID=45464 RepID=A0A2G9TRB6_TELCI|nr:hypothetical protein TELCIR_18026 [Teladorsagia circumcincta]
MACGPSRRRDAWLKALILRVLVQHSRTVPFEYWRNGDWRYYRDFPTGSVGLKYTGRNCEGTPKGRACRGRLRDTTLDWEDALPEPDFTIAYEYAKEKKANLAIHGLVDDVMSRVLGHLGIKIEEDVDEKGGKYEVPQIGLNRGEGK